MLPAVATVLAAVTGCGGGSGGVPQVATPPPAAASDADCDVTVGRSQDLVSEFSAAQGGETICLTAGSYGTFRGGTKPAPVTVRSAPGATVRMKLELDSVANLRIQGARIDSAVITGATHDLTIARSRFTGRATVDAAQMRDANVVFDGNTHADIDTCRTCPQGRLHIEGDGSGRSSGVVVKNSVFSGGSSDGVRADAGGVEIIGNEFSGLRDRGSLHTDPIQIYGGTNVVIRRNFFHDNQVSAAIVMADGGRDNLVEDNVVASGGQTWAMSWLADDGSVIRHNTFADGECDFGQRCGFINVGIKPGGKEGRPTVIRDNVMGGVSNGAGGGQARFVAERNLTSTPTAGLGNITALPKYVGPRTDYSGYRLATGSAGARASANRPGPGIR